MTKHQYLDSPFHFVNRFTRDLPADPVLTNERRQVAESSYSRVRPTPVASPQLIAHSEEVAAELGLTQNDVLSQQFVDVFSGNALYDGMDPYAMNYAGHQFGNWAGQLGDGRAINLGEVETPLGALWTLQLKGAGPTPYSRSADGRAVLRSSIREFLCSEAMFHLGVPTTRALSLIGTGDQVLRDMFYDGRPEMEPGAIVCRVSPSFIRFGNFQIHAARGETELLKRLMDFCIRTDFPHLGEPSAQTYLAWFQEVCDRTADLMVHWMRVGFVHGVMNTDNMSILGLTIDYGPYGWVDDYDLDWTPNTTDADSRRYIFGNQPQVAGWNLAQLARAIYPVVEDAETLGAILKTYASRYEAGYRRMMASKLGFAEFDAETDLDLFSGLLKLFSRFETDMTLFFRLLAQVDPHALPSLQWQALRPSQYKEATEPASAWSAWLSAWSARIIKDEAGAPVESRKGSRLARMNATNPKYVLRNYMAQMAIDRAHEGDFALIHELLNVLRNPYDEQPTYERYFAKRPDWARNKPGSSMLSCSS